MGSKTMWRSPAFPPVLTPTNYYKLSGLSLSRLTVYGRAGPPRKGGPTYGPCTMHRCASPSHGVPGCDQRDTRRVSAPRPAFAAALHAQMASWYLGGQPRTARRFTVYKHCPLPPGRAKPPSRLSRQRLAMPSLTRPLPGCGRCRSRPNASQWRWKPGVRKMSCRGCHPRRGILVR